MSVIPLSSIDKRLLLALPESLNLGRCFVLSAYMGSPGSLDSTGHCVPVFIPFAFKVKERFGVLDERLGNSHLPLITSDLGVRENSLTT